MRIFNDAALSWAGNNLCLARRSLASIEPDQLWPTMWRVRMPDGHLSDMVNRTRAKEAARALVLAVLNAKESPVAAPPMRSFGQPLSVGLST